MKIHQQILLTFKFYIIAISLSSEIPLPRMSVRCANKCVEKSHFLPESERTTERLLYKMISLLANRYVLRFSWICIALLAAFCRVHRQRIYFDDIASYKHTLTDTRHTNYITFYYLLCLCIHRALTWQHDESCWKCARISAYSNKQDKDKDERRKGEHDDKQKKICS